ncbi:MAG: aminotransferase class V-fold PLP-dependent enzyme [Clostridiales bacterium]|nr:aminotransferase class V-fold PLP-dependent enzyme [Clostridiales bacterium]
MYSFNNDYSEGAHPKILDRMIKANFEQNTGYTKDIHCMNAAKYIKELIDRKDVDIHFIPGGTQTNLLMISASLRPHQCVISADTGHINVHETGAIEATGHKVVAVATRDGKLTPLMIQEVLDYHTDEHMVQPRMVYISNSTELGTIYNKAELSALSRFCKQKDLLLFLDGARLGSALTSNSNDLDITDIARLVDAFYIGGTKNGALLGEALVICNDNLKQDFRYIIKQRGALMAKGFVLGLQFEVLFEDDLYFELANHANVMAEKLADIIKQNGYSFYVDPCTNQLFPILPNKVIEELSKDFLFSLQMKLDTDNSVIRLVTSWATKPASIDAFREKLNNLNN